MTMARVAPEPVSPSQPALPTPADHVIVLFGATGDLAHRKLLPGLFHLRELGLMPERFRIVAQARSAIDEFGRVPPSDERFESFATQLSFVGIGEGLGALAGAVEAARAEVSSDARVLHYLSVPPRASAGVIAELGTT
jgi:glucose-6-phosphate 1-dehydrogenase